MSGPVITEISQLLLQGWTMLSTSCPTKGCNVPLMKNREGQVYCVKCRLYVNTEEEAAAKGQFTMAPEAQPAPAAAPSPARSQTSTTAARYSPAPRRMEEVAQVQQGVEDDVKTDDMGNEEDEDDDEYGGWTPPTAEEMERVKALRAHSDKCSKRMGELLLERWRMLNETCLNNDCLSPLMEHPTEGYRFCVSCERRLRTRLDGSLEFMDPAPSSGVAEAKDAAEIESKSAPRSPAKQRSVVKQATTPTHTPRPTAASGNFSFATGAVNSSELATALNKAAAEQNRSKPARRVEVHSSRAPPPPHPSPAVSRPASGPASRTGSPEPLSRTQVLAAPSDWANMTQEQLREFAARAGGGVGAGAGSTYAASVEPVPPSSRASSPQPALAASENRVLDAPADWSTMSLDDLRDYAANGGAAKPRIPTAAGVVKPPPKVAESPQVAEAAEVESINSQLDMEDDDGDSDGPTRGAGGRDAFFSPTSLATVQHVPSAGEVSVDAALAAARGSMCKKLVASAALLDETRDISKCRSIVGLISDLKAALADM